MRSTGPAFRRLSNSGSVRMHGHLLQGSAPSDEGAGEFEEVEGEGEAVAGAGFVEEGGDVAFHGLQLEVEERGDLAVGFSFREPVSDVRFARGETGAAKGPVFERDFRAKLRAGAGEAIGIGEVILGESEDEAVALGIINGVGALDAKPQQASVVGGHMHRSMILRVEDAEALGKNVEIAELPDGDEIITEERPAAVDGGIETEVGILGHEPAEAGDGVIPVGSADAGSDVELAGPGIEVAVIDLVDGEDGVEKAKGVVDEVARVQLGGIEIERSLAQVAEIGFGDHGGGERRPSQA